MKNISRKIITSFSFIVLIALTTACTRYASEKNFDAIYLNMDKQEAMNKMHSKGVARGSILNKYNQVIEVREYQVDKGKDGREIAGVTCLTICTFGLAAPLFFTAGEIDTYWLYFCDGKLVQWGRAGDWAEAQRMVYDVNFKISSKN